MASNTMIKPRIKSSERRRLESRGRNISGSIQKFKINKIQNFSYGLSGNFNYSISYLKYLFWMKIINRFGMK